MTEWISFPVHGKAGSLVGLEDVLDCVHENEWSWRLVDFYGTGFAPDGMGMPEFEEVLRSTPEGLPFTWREMRDFARGLDQVHDCLVVASESGAGVDPAGFDAVEQGDLGDFALAIRALDSTEWTVGVGDSIAGRGTLLSRLSSSFQ